jgi:hypothetical protein
MPIYSPAGVTRNTQPRSYIPEIEEVGDKGLEFHIANRHDDITRLLRQVAYSEKPNFAIIGSPGIGKTLAVNYIVDVITGKINLPKEHGWHPLFEAIKTKAREFQTRDYLFLPNLSDPYRPVVLDFVNGEIKSASDHANAFCNDVIRLFENIGLEEKIFPYFEKNGFRNYLKQAVKNIYQSLYRKMNGVVEVPASFDLKVTPKFTGYEIKYDFLDRVSWQDLKSGLSMRTYTQRKRCKGGKMRRVTKNVTKYQVQDKLRKDLRLEIKGDIIQLLSVINDAEVPGLDLEQKREILLDVLSEAKKEYDLASGKYKNDKNLISYYHSLGKLRAFSLPDLNLSPESLDWCNKNLEQILDRYKDAAHPALADWMKSVVRYFRENVETVSSQIIDCYLDARGERVIKRDKKSSLNITLSHPFADIGNDEFALPHGGDDFYLKYLLKPKQILLSKAGEICVKFPTSFSKDDMWGRIGKPEDDDDDDDKSDGSDGDLPPHRRFTPGYLMESSMVVLVDNMQGFFKALLGSEVQGAAAKRQAILTFVEEGNLMIEDKGITFVVHSPTMIVGCDNENPFVKFHGTYADVYEFDESMYTRFTVFDWDDLTANVPKARKETIGVVNSAVSDFNKKHKLGLRLSPEVIDQLLIEWSWPDLLKLDYRSLRARVVELLGFTRIKGADVCSLEHLIENEKENEPKWIHHFIDNEIYEMIKNPPEKAVGEVRGVSLYGLCYHPRYMPGDISTIRSAVIVDTPSGVGKNFQQYNIDAKLTDETAIKGFNEAVDFVKRQIGSPVRFISKTTFHREFESAGDSASLAMATAISSALSETPIRSNTVYTGNLSFFDGTVGPIGGIYNKARTVWRANQLLNKEKGKRMRFVFPVENYRELTEMLKTSSYPIANEIDLIPVNTFAEAFYLGATNTKINTETLPQKANALWDKTLKQIRENVKRWNNDVLKAYGKKPIE